MISLKFIFLVLYCIILSTYAPSPDVYAPHKYFTHIKSVFKPFNSSKPAAGLIECTDPSLKAIFSPWDYTMLVLMLVISIGIGIFYGYFEKKSNASKEFLLGSQMPIFPVSLSLSSSFITAIEMLGNPSEMYFHGTQFLLIGKLLKIY